MDSRTTVIGMKHITLSNTASQVERRKHFKKSQLQELAATIKTRGLLQAIIARPKGKGHEVVAGERRYLANKIAGNDLIEARVLKLSDEEVLEVQLIENLQRTDLHPMEEAEGYQALMKKHGHPIEELYARVGKSRSYVYGRLKLIALCKQARTAFYDGKINASIALLIARIPVAKLQREASQTIIRNNYSVRRAKEHIQRNYMLALDRAYFPKNNDKLVPSAGACGNCPKRTGNHPDLFGDVKGADVCTDPVCFLSKTKAHSKRLIAEANARGRKVITGAEAKNAWPWGDVPGDNTNLRGYSALNKKPYEDRRRRTVRQIIGKDAETMLLQNPRGGFVVEVVPDSVVSAALRKDKSTVTSRAPSSSATAQNKKVKLERAFRVELYNRVREKLKAPRLQDVALALWREMQHESQKTTAKLQGWEPTKAHGYANYRDLAKKIPKLRGQALNSFIHDCVYAAELQVNLYFIGKPERLLEAAKRHKVSPTTVRRAVAPKKKKAKAKKKASRRAKMNPKRPAKKKAKAKRKR